MNEWENMATKKLNENGKFAAEGRMAVNERQKWKKISSTESEKSCLLEKLKNTL